MKESSIEELFWARQDVYLEQTLGGGGGGGAAGDTADAAAAPDAAQNNGSSGTSNGSITLAGTNINIKELIAQVEEDNQEVRLPDGSILPECSFQVHTKRMTQHFHQKWTKMKGVYESKLVQLDKSRHSLQEMLSKSKQDLKEYKTRAHSVLEGHKTQLRKAMTDNKKHHDLEQKYRVLEAQLEEAKDKFEATEDLETQLHQSKADILKLKHQIKRLKSDMEAKQHEHESQVIGFTKQIKDHEQDYQRHQEKVREESSVQNAKLVAAFRQEQDRLTKMLEEEKEKRYALERNLGQTTGAAAADAAAGDNSNQSRSTATPEDSSSSDKKTPRKENASSASLADTYQAETPRRSNEYQMHIKRLQKLLRETELKQQSLKAREKNLLDDIDELNRSLARANAGQSEYQKNILVKYMENVSEQDALLPVVAQVLKLSSHEVDKIRKKRSESSSFFSLNFM